MKALEKAQTDDLNDEQKKLLSELIRKEMISKIESCVNQGNFQLVETIKEYIRTDEEAEKEKASQAAASAKSKKK